jgi:hypothetical protein
MSQCPLSKTDPLSIHQSPSAQFVLMCPLCGLSGIYSDHFDTARFLFWREHDSQDRKERLMSSEKCNHKQRRLGLWSSGGNPCFVHAQCENCGLMGPPATTIFKAEESFWKQENKENPMAQAPTYEQGYRRGVEDGTKPLYAGWEGSTVLTSVVNLRLGERRKELLTKKVTKWVIVLKKEDRSEERIPEGRLFDSEKSASKWCDGYYGSSALGVFPIEIEVPID